MLIQALARTARAFPERTAIVYRSSRLSYSEFYGQVRALMGGLQRVGLPGEARGRCVAIVLPNCPELILSFHAVAGVGAVALLLNPSSKEPELVRFLRESRAELLMTDLRHAARCARAISQVDPGIRLLVTEGAFASAMPWGELLAGGPPAEEREPPEQEGTVLYQLSSGSTGLPKRVARTQRNLLAEASSLTATAGITSADTLLCVTPLFHAYAFGNCLLAAPFVGATLVVLEPRWLEETQAEVSLVSRVPELLGLIQRERVTTLPAVPYLWSALAEASPELEVDVSSLRLCFSAGTSLPESVAARFRARFGISIRQQYGCTEAGAVALDGSPDPSLHPGSTGHPIRGVTLRVVNEAGEPLPAGQIGEIWFTSPAMTAGYEGVPASVNEALFPGGGFQTGDLGMLGADGSLTLTGRKRRFIPTAGHKVDPVELEELLAQHPAVAEVAVVGVPEPSGEEWVKAVIVPRAPCGEGELRAFCQERLADFKLPRIIEFRERLPRSPLGKLLRKELLEPAGPLRPAPAAHTPERVLELLRERLALLLEVPPEQIEAERPLGELGLSSVMLVDVVVHVREALGISVSPTVLWRYPDLAAFSTHLAALTRAGGEARER